MNVTSCVAPGARVNFLGATVIQSLAERETVTNSPSAVYGVDRHVGRKDLVDPQPNEVRQGIDLQPHFEPAVRARRDRADDPYWNSSGCGRYGFSRIGEIIRSFNLPPTGRAPDGVSAGHRHIGGRGQDVVHKLQPFTSGKASQEQPPRVVRGKKSVSPVAVRTQSFR